MEQFFGLITALLQTLQAKGQYCFEMLQLAPLGWFVESAVAAVLEAFWSQQFEPVWMNWVLYQRRASCWLGLRGAALRES